jgi:hypothetical protein
MATKKLKNINLEKIGVYIAAITGFWTIFNSLMDVRERIAKIEVRLEHLEAKSKTSSETK